MRLDRFTGTLELVSLFSLGADIVDSLRVDLVLELCVKLGEEIPAHTELGLGLILHELLDLAVGHCHVLDEVVSRAVLIDAKVRSIRDVEEHHRDIETVLVVLTRDLILDRGIEFERLTPNTVDETKPFFEEPLLDEGDHLIFREVVSHVDRKSGLFGERNRRDRAGQPIGRRD